MKKELSEKELEERVKQTFCDLKTIIHCDYSGKYWCKKTCGFYKNAETIIKYWSR